MLNSRYKILTNNNNNNKIISPQIKMNQLMKSRNRNVKMRIKIYKIKKINRIYKIQKYKR